MKNGSNARLKAMQFEGIRLTSHYKGAVRWSDLYAVEGMPGIFRRVASDGDLFASDPGVVQAYFGDKRLTLMRCDGIETELHEAGFMKSGPDVGLLPREVARAAVDRLFHENDGRDAVGATKKVTIEQAVLANLTAMVSTPDLGVTGSE